MAGWRCPQGDASSQWLIVIRTDLFLPTPTMIAVQIHICSESEPLAELAQLIGQTDLFGTPAKPPVPLQSRANVRPQYALAEEEASAPAGPPSWRLRARQEAPPLQEYEEPEQPSPVHPLHRYAASIAPAGPTPWMLRARQEAPPLQEYEDWRAASRSVRTGPSRATTRHGRAAG